MFLLVLEHALSVHFYSLCYSFQAIAAFNVKTCRKIQQQFISVQKLAGDAIPQRLFVQKQSYESFTTFSRLLVLNERQQAWGSYRTQEQNEKIWLHELGHTFFINWLSRDFKPIQDFRD